MTNSFKKFEEFFWLGHFKGGEAGAADEPHDISRSNGCRNPTVKAPID